MPRDERLKGALVPAANAIDEAVVRDEAVVAGRPTVIAPDRHRG